MWVFLLTGCAALCCAQQTTVTGRVVLGDGTKVPQAGGVVVWLVPAAENGEVPPLVPPQPLRLVQKNKSFSPHVLVVPVGSVVGFPNRDPFFHNVFSLFEGKRFDLGLYEAGTSRDVRFDKPGISYIFCNIHAEMSAVVIALDTPYYGISTAQGEIVIPNVPSGHYSLRMWSEAALPEALNALKRDVTVSENNSNLGVLRVSAASLPPQHKNKYGKDYEPVTPNTAPYQR